MQSFGFGLLETYILGLQLMVASGKIHSFVSLTDSSHCIHPSPCFIFSPNTSSSHVKRTNRLSQLVFNEAAQPLTSQSNFDDLAATISNPIPELYSVDVRYNSRSPLTYDESTGRYLDVVTPEQLSSNDNDEANSKVNGLSRFLQSAFVPEGVTPSYYRFMRWRILQRFINANVHVIGTQSLLMGLRGMHRNGVGAVATGAAAATNWVLKDTLGKIVRMGEL
jgi:hypothetical protein